jgi:hypothetical protein
MPGLKCVFTAYGRLEAEMVKSLLTSEGIECFLNQEGAGDALGLSIGALGKVYLLVRPDDAENASLLLKTVDFSDSVDRENVT